MNGLLGKAFRGGVINKKFVLLTFSMVLSKKLLTNFLDGLYLQAF
jgi:hypothetical protein